MEVLYEESGSVGVIITTTQARPGVLALIVVVDDIEQTEAIIYLKLSELNKFLGTTHAKSKTTD